MSDGADIKGRRILVVEDDFLIAQDLCAMLRDLGYEPLGPVPSIPRALALLDTEAPDGALLDENLSGQPVTPVAEALRRQDIPFAIVSGYSRSISTAPILKGAERLSKPPSHARIGEVIETLLGPRAE